MICARCGSANSPGRKFCGECGAPLAATCSACGAANEPGVKFCGECGQSLTAPTTPAGEAPDPRESDMLEASAEPIAERRLVTVLFADLVGFTGLSEDRDPEDVRDLLSRYFALAREIVARYGGSIEKFIGDAVMAVWGSPSAHEDDAERAVRAALELVEGVARIGSEEGIESLRARAGVTTGEAAVTIGAESEGMVAGDMVNTAARLQSAAEPGAVLVGESTYLAAGRGVAFERGGTLDLKGKSLPVETWRALRLSAGVAGARRTDALEPPFTGRDEELRVLKDLLHTTEREQRPRLVSVVGLGGIGKSRLAWEFEKYADGILRGVYWHRGRSPAYGDGLAFWALAEMVRGRFGIAETDDEATSRDLLASGLAEYVPDPEERRWVAPRVSQLLGLGEAPSNERDELFAAWRVLFERIAGRGPVVMVFEDLHWADTGLLDFVEHVLRSARGCPILVVTLARPELLDRRPDWGAGLRNFMSVGLEPLGPEVTAELVTALVPDLPGETRGRIVDRSEGIPLFVVEIVRMLLNRGELTAAGGVLRSTGDLGRFEVPATLHSLVASRIDALDSEDRALLQRASVLGKSFTIEGLRALAPELATGDRLRGLVDRELLLLESDPRSPERGQYSFIQSILREVAYGTLSKRDRLAMHVAAADHFESVDEGDLAAVIAEHLVAACELRARSAGPDRLADRTRTSLVAAADRAEAVAALSSALHYLNEALELSALDTQRGQLEERRGELQRQIGDYDEANESFDRALEIYRELDDIDAQARAVAGIALVRTRQGRPEEGTELLETFLRANDRVDHPTFEVIVALAVTNWLGGDDKAALVWADRALSEGSDHDDIATTLDLLNVRCAVLANLGRNRDFLADRARAVDLAERHGLKLLLSTHLANQASELYPLDLLGAMEAGERSFVVRAELGLPPIFELYNLCLAALHAGGWDRMDAELDSVVTEELSPFDRLVVLLPRSVFHAFLGRIEEADAILDELRPMVSELSYRDTETEFLNAAGWVAIATGRFGDAFDCGIRAGEVRRWLSDPVSWAIAGYAALRQRDVESLRAALRPLRSFDSDVWLASCWGTAIEAGLAALDGRRGEAGDLFDRAGRVATESGAVFDLGLIEVARLGFGLDAEAVRTDLEEEANGIFERLGARTLLEQLRFLVRVQG